MSEHELLTRLHLDHKTEFGLAHSYYTGGEVTGYDTSEEMIIDEHGNGKYIFTYQRVYIEISHHLNVEYPKKMMLTDEYGDHIDADINYSIKVEYQLTDISIGRPEDRPSNLKLTFKLVSTVELSSNEKGNPSRWYDKAKDISFDLKCGIYDSLDEHSDDSHHFSDRNVVLTPRLVETLGLSVDKFIFNSYTTPTTSSSDSYNECIYSMDFAVKSVVVGVSPDISGAIEDSISSHLDDKFNDEGIIEWFTTGTLSLLKINTDSYTDLDDYSNLTDLSSIIGENFSSIRRLIPNEEYSFIKDGTTVSYKDNQYSIDYMHTIVPEHYKEFIWSVTFTVEGSAKTRQDSGTKLPILDADVTIQLTNTGGYAGKLGDFLGYYNRPKFNVTASPDGRGFLTCAGVTYEL